jgi:hypothetical protein
VVGLACQSSDSPAPTASGGSSSQGGSGAQAGSAQGGAGGAAAGSPGGAGTAQGGAAGSGACAGTEKAISDLNQATRLPAADQVLLKGVVAASQKFLVSPSKSGCLWGVFVTTAGGPTEYGSIQLVSKGDPPVAGANGKDVCKTDPGTTGKIPDDIQPGDVFDVSGFPDEFLVGGANGCGMPNTNMPGTNNPKPAVGQRQLKDLSCISPLVKGGPAPAPKEISDVATLNQIAAGTNEGDINLKWGGALVKVTGPFNSVQTPASDYTGTAMTSAVSKYGAIAVAETPLLINNAIYYTDESCGGPKASGKRYEYTQPTTFNSFTGIVAVNFCTWEVAIRARCGDIDPPSSVCAADPVCPAAGGGGAGGSTGGAENTAELCSDGQDNDGNNFIDCNDKGCCSVVDCSAEPTSYCGKKGAGGSGGSSGGGENTVALCSDGVDNDGNKYIDCDDKGCCGIVDCTSKPTSYCGKMGK